MKAKTNKEMTREFWDKMTTTQFEEYLDERRALKPYLDRFVKEVGYSAGIQYEDWLKVELRNDKLKELGI